MDDYGPKRTAAWLDGLNSAIASGKSDEWLRGVRDAMAALETAMGEQGDYLDNLLTDIEVQLGLGEDDSAKAQV